MIHLRVNNMILRPEKLPVTAIILTLLLFSCSRTALLEREASEFLKAGQYEGALDRYQRIIDINPDSIEGRRGLGMILSSRRISVFSGLEILEKLLADHPVAETRNDLVELYIDMELYSKADMLLSPEKLSLEEFFDFDNTIFRQGLACLKNPGDAALNTLLKAKDSDQKNIMLIRCLRAREFSIKLQKIKPAKSDQERAAFFLDVLHSIKSDEKKCEAVTMLPDSVNDISLLNQTAKEECRKKYLSNLFLHRQRPVIAEDVRFIQPEVIFSDETRTAPYEGSLPAFPEETPAPASL